MIKLNWILLMLVVNLSYSQFSIYEQPPTEVIGYTRDLDANDGKSLHRTVIDGVAKYKLNYWYKGVNYGFSWNGEEATNQFYNQLVYLYNSYQKPSTQKYLVGNTVVTVEMGKGHTINAKFKFFDTEGLFIAEWEGMGIKDIHRLFGKDNRIKKQKAE